MFTHPEKNIKEAYIGEGMKVAEFGAGIGHHTLPIARRVGESGVVYAIDIQPPLLEKLANEAREQKLENIHTILSDVDRPNGSTLADKSVDRVLIFNTLFQLENKRAAFNEARRILKPDGRLVIIDWLDSFGYLGPHPDQVTRPEQASLFAREVDFKFDSRFEAGPHHYGLIYSL